MKTFQAPLSPQLVIRLQLLATERQNDPWFRSPEATQGLDAFLAGFAPDEPDEALFDPDVAPLRPSVRSCTADPTSPTPWEGK